MKKRILSLVLALCMLNSLFSIVSISGSAASAPSDWAVTEVNAAINEGLVTNKITKNYQKAITREEFCELVVKLYQKLTNETVSAGYDPFIDTDNEEILKAYSLGIVKGVSDNKFAPNNNITRQEICVMLTRCIDVAIDGADITRFETKYFADGNSIADWAIDSVNYAFDNEIIKGVGDNRVDPLGNTTCEQAILLVYRIYKNQASLNGNENTVYKFDVDDIKTDTDTDISYIDNIIIVFFDKNASEIEKQALVDSVNGVVVGKFDSINQYQIRISERDLTSLKQLCNELEKNDCVLMATYDMAVKVDTNKTPNDPWKDNKKETWDESNPSGSNWWIEVIQASSAWDYDDKLLNINIGIVDDGFDTGHEDLKNKITFADKADKKFNDKKDHGTHVAGIIGAAKDNKKGISGITNNSKLICYDWYPNAVQGNISEIQQLLDNDIRFKLSFIGIADNEINSILQEIKEAFASKGISLNEYKRMEEEINNILKNKGIDIPYELPELPKAINWNTTTNIIVGLVHTVEAGAKVINFSLGTSGSLTTNSNSYSQQQIDEMAKQASMYMSLLLYEGNDFIVVQSSGNGAKDGIGVDAINNGWFASITRDNCYDELASVDKILDRIIIVGAAEQNGNSYRQTSFSNGGNQVDICAPGQNIYSTVTGGLFGGYDNMSGTSMAAPIVTGVAALVWSADISLSGADVKKIICDPKNTIYEVADNTQSPNTTGTFRMVNAKLAVEDALGIVNRYRVVNKEMTWEEAKTYCENLGGHLATITSESEQKTIEDLLKTGTKNIYWIGGFKNNNNWCWVDNSVLGYSNWGKNEPNDWSNNEVYLEIVKTPFDNLTTGDWNDNSLTGGSIYGRTYGFICEFD